MSQVVVGIISRKNSENQDEYLLVSAKRNFGEFTGFYYPPGGHLEEGEEKTIALTREIKEELNLEVEPVKEIVETLGDIEGQITFWWLCDLISGDLKIDNSEIADARFFSKEEMQNLNLWPATKKFFDEYVFNNSL